MSKTCTTLGLGLAFVATLLLNYFGGEGPSLPLWQKAAYFLAGGTGAVVILSLLASRPQRPVNAVIRQRPDTTVG